MKKTILLLMSTAILTLADNSIKIIDKPIALKDKRELI